MAATGSPITFIGTGEHFEDLEPFDPASFISKIMGRGDVKGLFERFKDTIDEEQVCYFHSGIRIFEQLLTLTCYVSLQSEKMMERLGKGKFTFRDFYEQLQQIQKLGPINKVMEMIPGFQNVMDQLPEGADASARFKRFLYIMDSMNNAELDGLVSFDDSRVARVARGSGSSEMDVRLLLKCHKQFEKVFGMFVTVLS